MSQYRVELIELSGDRSIAGVYDTERDAAKRILQVKEAVTIELWRDFTMLARIDRSKPKVELKAPPLASPRNTSSLIISR